MTLFWRLNYHDVLLLIKRRFSDVLIITSFYQQCKNVSVTSSLQSRFINNITTSLGPLLIDIIFTSMSIKRFYDMVERGHDVKATAVQCRYDVYVYWTTITLGQGGMIISRSNKFSEEFEKIRASCTLPGYFITTSKAISVIFSSLTSNCKVTLSVNIITACTAWWLFSSYGRTVFGSKTLREAVLCMEVFHQAVYIFLSSMYLYILCS